MTRESLMKKIQDLRDEHDYISTADILGFVSEATKEMREALEKFIARYVSLVNSGDAGFWNPEKEEVVIAARAVLEKYK